MLSPTLSRSRFLAKNIKIKMVDDRCAMATSCGSLNNKMAVLEVLIIFLKSLKFSVLVSFRGCFFAQIWNLKWYFINLCLYNVIRV